MRLTILAAALLFAGCTDQFETTFPSPSICVARAADIRALIREEGRLNSSGLPDSEQGLALIDFTQRETSVVVEVRKWDSGDGGTSSIIERWTFEPLGASGSEWCLTRVMQTFGRGSGRWAPPGPDVSNGD